MATNVSLGGEEVALDLLNVPSVTSSDGLERDAVEQSEPADEPISYRTRRGRIRSRSAGPERGNGTPTPVRVGDPRAPR